MSITVQARLDAESEAALKKLMKRLGWSSSQAVREGLQLLVRHYEVSPRKRKKIIGMGEFDAGPIDLATNKKHMEGFGR
jgi:hypothetical protein